MEVTLQQTASRRLTLSDGIRAGVPIAIGYIPIAVAFGLLAKSSGVPSEIAMLMSCAIFAGASQFVGINLLALGTAYWEIVLATFILNLRHFLMTASLAGRVENQTSKPWLALVAFGVTDETFTVASLREERELSKEFLLALNAMAFGAWNAGTWIGLFLAEGLPESIKASMGIALYAMFVGLLIPSMRRSRPVLLIAGAAMLFHGLLKIIPGLASLSAGWSIVFATVAGAGLGAWLFPEGGEE